MKDEIKLKELENEKKRLDNQKELIELVKEFIKGTVHESISKPITNGLTIYLFSS